MDLDTSKTCIIHVESVDPGSNLVSPRDLDSWNTLLRAARLRQHTSLLDLAATLSEGEVPIVFYHRKCRQIFTMKRDLEELEYESDSAILQPKRQSARGKALSSRILDKSCIFCPPDKSTKYVKGTRTREPLVQCVELQADARIREVARKRNDAKVLALTSRDLVAAEAWYHKSCYRLYTSVKGTDENNSTFLQYNLQDSNYKYKVAEREAYGCMTQYVQCELFQTPKVVKFTQLTSMLKEHMLSLGVEIQECTKKHLRRKLETDFGNMLHIVSDASGKLLVFPDSLSSDSLVRENQELKKELSMLKEDIENIQHVLAKAALHLRSTIKHLENSNNWPFLPSALTDLQIPEDLTNFIFTLITGEMLQKNPTKRSLLHVDSIAQDIVYTVSGGSQVPPKHILLPVAVKALTGNVELIRILNRLGHGMSYTKVEENETALCLLKISGAANEVMLPENIIPHLFTTLAWDNIDQIEETLTGEGTTHRVNGIIVQPKTFGPEPNKPLFPAVQKDKKRSLTLDEDPLPVYVPGERTGPPNLRSVDLHSSEVTNKAHKKNLVWMLTRQVHTENQ